MRLIRTVVGVLTSSLFFCLVAPNVAEAAEIYSSDWNNQGIGFGLNATYWSAQKFYAGTSQTITKIEVKSGGNQFTVKIRAQGTSAPGTLISTFSYSSNSAGIYVFTGTFSAVAGNYYWLSLENVSAQTSINALQTANDVSSFGWSSAGTVMSSTDNGVNWGTGSVGGYNYFSIRMSTSTTALATPAQPNVSDIQNTSVSVSETSAITNASTYAIRLYQSNGVTLVESKTVSTITSPTNFNNLQPGTLYKVGVTAVGDGINYDSSSESTQTSFTTTATTSVSISGIGNLIYRTASTLTFTVSGGEGRLTLFVNNKRVGGCISKLTSSLTASCIYKPSLRGNLNLAVNFKPTNPSLGQSSTSTLIKVSARNSLR